MTNRVHSGEQPVSIMTINLHKSVTERPVCVCVCPRDSLDVCEKHFCLSSLPRFQLFFYYVVSVSF